jgi:hypothetical protein
MKRGDARPSVARLLVIERETSIMGLVECIVYLATNYGVAGATES